LSKRFYICSGVFLLINITEQVLSRPKAILVGIGLPGVVKEEVRYNISELKQLARTAGFEVVHDFVQERDKIHPAYFIGPGKVTELQELLQNLQGNLLIVDEDLSPAQIRNLEISLEVKIIDRSTLILDIFAKHAQTRQAKTQVELAQLQYFLPRLTRQWSHLSRQVGGIGTRGPGETQLETDRRLIRKRIEKLKNDLVKIDKQQNVRRKQRQNEFRVSLVGYTNVGKSTIMNLLSDAGVAVENQLFETLDSVVRKVNLDNDHSILLSDTVGFIRKLPHHLIASFKSTLDEVREADLLLHVVDISHSQYSKQMEVVIGILEELDVHTKNILTIFNKIDRLEDPNLIQSVRNKYPVAHFLSAKRHIGVEMLKSEIIQFIEANFVEMTIFVPVQDQKFIHYIHSNTRVMSQVYEDDSIEFTIRCDTETADKIRSLANKRNFKTTTKKTEKEIT
jgi:GTP-binding protein HflX